MVMVYLSRPSPMVKRTGDLTMLRCLRHGEKQDAALPTAHHNTITTMIGTVAPAVELVRLDDDSMTTFDKLRNGKILVVGEEGRHMTTRLSRLSLCPHNFDQPPSLTALALQTSGHHGVSVVLRPWISSMPWQQITRRMGRWCSWASMPMTRILLKSLSRRSKWDDHANYNATSLLLLLH